MIPNFKNICKKVSKNIRYLFLKYSPVKMAKLLNKKLYSNFQTRVFFILVLAVFLPLLTVGMYLDTRSSYLLEQKTISANNAKIDRIDDLLNLYFENLQNNLDTISKMAPVKSLDKLKMQSILIENVKSSALIRSLFVADESGNVIYDTSGKSYFISDESYFNNTLRGNPSFSEIKFSDLNGKPLDIIYSVPISIGSRIIGIVGANIDIKSINQVVNKITNDGPDNTFIVDHNGSLVAHRDWEKVVNTGFYKDFDAVKQAVNGNSGDGIFTYQGEKYLCVFSPMNGIRWSIIATAPYSVAFKDIIRHRAVFVCIIILTFITTIFMAYHLSAYVAKPLYELTVTMSAISEGNLNSGLKDELLKRKDQFGKLAKAFNTMMENIQSLTYYDPVTYLPNRKYFVSRLTSSIQQFHGSQPRIAILFIQVDNFKNITNTFGHLIGDMLLKEVAHVLQGHVNKDNTLARMGGDEFCLTFFNVERKEMVVAAAKTILREVSNPWYIENQAIRITASLGIAFYPDDGLDEQTLIKNVEIALYKAKEIGGNTYEFYDADINETYLEQLKISNAMYQALENDEFTLHYQPFVDTKTRKIVGMEALIRWNHHELGTVPPSKFIPLAEDNGLIIPISQWVLQTACEQLVKFQNKGWSDLYISINISAQHFLSPNFVQSIRNILEKYGIDGRSIEIEITEYTAIKNEVHTNNIFRELKDIGVRLALDDFGTGYSSLSYLTKFAFHSIKIDKSFIFSILKNGPTDAIIATIISIGKALKLEVIAEGVETAEQLDFLVQHQCDTIQGFYFSRPVAPEQFELLLEKQQL